MNAPTKQTLTKDQQDAADAFFKFLLTDASTFVLSGGAGTGKTFLMNYISNTLMKRYEQSCAIMGIDTKQYEVHFTATTNKAAEVLERSVNTEVNTIHSFLGLRVFDDYKTGQTKISNAGKGRYWRNIILFIDESSMIDAQLKKYIDAQVTDSKIIYVGDKAQLAPVGEDLSPVYKNVNPENFIHLTQSVRNADSPALMHLCSQLRHTVATGKFFPIQAVPGSIEYLDDDQMQAELGKHFMKSTDTARILCYTNSRVNAYNEYIREIRGLPPEFVAGDDLIMARTFSRGKLTLNVEREFKVIQADSTIHKSGFAHVTPDGEEVTYRNLVISPRSSFYGSEIELPVPTDPFQVTEAIKKLGRKKEWDGYFRLKNEFADLRGKEACTVYKSQGSTYDTVFIDIGNIGCSFDPEQVARMLFVGVSRATTKVFLYGELPAKYQGRFNSVYTPEPEEQLTS